MVAVRVGFLVAATALSCCEVAARGTEEGACSRKHHPFGTVSSSGRVDVTPVEENGNYKCPSGDHAEDASGSSHVEVSGCVDAGSDREEEDALREAIDESEREAEHQAEHQAKNDSINQVMAANRTVQQHESDHYTAEALTGTSHQTLGQQATHADDIIQKRATSTLNWKRGVFGVVAVALLVTAAAVLAVRLFSRSSF